MTRKEVNRKKYLVVGESNQLSRTVSVPSEIQFRVLAIKRISVVYKHVLNQTKHNNSDQIVLTFISIAHSLIRQIGNEIGEFILKWNW